MSDYDRVNYDWRVLHSGTERYVGCSIAFFLSFVKFLNSLPFVSKTPNIRSNGVSWVYNGAIWLICGAGAGLGEINIICEVKEGKINVWTIYLKHLGKTSDIWKYTIDTRSWLKVSCTGLKKRNK